MNNKQVIEQWVRKEDYEKETRFYGKNPRAVIFGERHTDLECPLKQIELLSGFNSVFLLHEFARNYIFDFQKRRIYENPDYPIPDESIKFAKRELSRRQSPVGFMDDAFKKWLEENQMKSLLNKYESSYLALEFCTDTSLGAILRRLPVSINQVVGCDVSYAEMNSYERKNKVELSSILSSRKHHAFREKRFAEVIGKYTLLNTELVIAVMGAYHIEKYSKIHRELKEKGIEYVCINQ